MDPSEPCQGVAKIQNLYINFLAAYIIVALLGAHAGVLNANIHVYGLLLAENSTS